MVLLRKPVRKIQFIIANIKNSLWTEPLNLLTIYIIKINQSSLSLDEPCRIQSDPHLINYSTR